MFVARPCITFLFNYSSKLTRFFAMNSCPADIYLTSKMEIPGKCVKPVQGWQKRHQSDVNVVVL